MANSTKAPKQWSLPSDADVSGYEKWKNNLLFTFSTESLYAPFLGKDVTWLKQTKANPKRGFTDDGADVPEKSRKTAVQKVYALELMLGQIANYAPINRGTIVYRSTSLASVWKAIRQHLNIQATGARILDLANMSLVPGERPEVLYERLLAFVDDNLMTAEGNLTHFGDAITEDEEVTPIVDNIIVVTWLRLIHKDLPKIVKDRYATELRSRSLASIKDEISTALESLLEQVQANKDARALRSQIGSNNNGSRNRNNFNGSKRTDDYAQSSKSNRECPLCDQVGRANTDHYLSECRYLPGKDKKYMSKLKARAGTVDSDEEEDDDNEDASARAIDLPLSARRVPVCSSPYLDVFYKHHPVRITIDSGATGNFIRHDVAIRINAVIRKHSQHSNQADGRSSLKIVGETSLKFTFRDHTIIFDALIASDLDEDILGGTPFMDRNDVWIRPSQKFVAIGEKKYDYKVEKSPALSSNRVVTEVLRSPDSMVVWPGEYVEVSIPEELSGEDVMLEPRTDTPVNSKCMINQEWPNPQIIKCSANRLRIPNLSREPKLLRKGEHFCQIGNLSTVPHDPVIPQTNPKDSKQVVKDDPSAYKQISIDPQNITPNEYKLKLECLCESYSHVFNPKFKGYNGRDGAVKATVNMGPVLPPQRKGRMPVYNKDKLQLLQNKFDELEELGVFEKPENVSVNVEYLNSSFLVRKPRGGHRLVTDFGDVGRYSKPQPSLMPDMDSILRTIAQWKYIIQTDLCKAYFQIPMDPASMKFCGVATPFKGIRVYVRSAMGMPGSESALEEVMCRVLGDMIESGKVVKLADNLYCGGNSLSELCVNWEELLRSLSRNALHLSATQTVINPKSTNILGWVWTQGYLSASPHSICTLSTCKRPTTVTQLRSFIGAYKVLSRVITMCAEVIAPLDSMTAGRSSSEQLLWSSQNIAAFDKAQQHVSKAVSIKMPQKCDKLWIVMDAATKKPAIGSTLYVDRPGSNKLEIGSFFSAKLSSNQIDWLPCEREALGIASSVKYFQPYIVQSEHKAACLTDSQPCVQAFAKMMKGEFSASPRVSTFLSVCHRFQVSVQHISGVNNALSDHGSRNPAECEDKTCQVCRFISEIECSVVRASTVQDIISGKVKVPFLSRTAWQSTQLECPDLRRTHAHLRQGTRPSRKSTNIRDIKRYLNKITIARDGLLILRNDEPNAICKERIVVPRSCIDGLLASLHIKLDHPLTNQMKLIAHRYFFALDMDAAIERVTGTCHICSSLESFTHAKESQTCSDPPDGVGTQFAADVIRRERQYIFLLREVVTSYTWSTIIPNEQASSLREALLLLCIPIRPMDGPQAVVRVDYATGFVSLKEDDQLASYGIVLDIGRVKNKNKNPVAERAVQEMENELLKQDPTGGSVDQIRLASATSRLNARIRSRGLSSREMLLQRDQFSNQQIPVCDRELIIKQHEAKLKNHPHSEKSKAPLKEYRIESVLDVGDLVYLYNDKDKTKARDRYIVVRTDNEWIYIRKFTGKQLRNASYKVKRTECYKVPSVIGELHAPLEQCSDTCEDVLEDTTSTSEDKTPVDKPLIPLPESLPSIPNEIVPTNHDLEETTSALPLEVTPLDPEEETSSDNEFECPTESRPQRKCRPPDKLSLKWDNTQSYE